MHKFYKQKLYKKYKDEIWGHLVTSKNFSYNKKVVLLAYRDKLVKGRLRIKTKYRYHKRGFLKRLNYSLFEFKNYRKRLRVLNFNWKKSTNSAIIINRRTKRFLKGSLFFKKKLIALLKINIQLIGNFIKKDHKSKSVSIFSNSFKPLIFPQLDSKKAYVMRRTLGFLKKNNLKFRVKKRLNLRRQKVFFYSIHVAAPRKKTKKWSLFGLKNIYYKKISLFFGFKKRKSFFKLYEQISGIWGRNEFQLFLSLEGRLENILLRLNFFPSIYFIKRFISSGNVFVNNKVINYPSYFLSYNEIISIEKSYLKLIYSLLKSRLLAKKVLLNSPSFVEVDYKLMVAMLVRNPTPADLTLPVSFNLYTRFLSFMK